MPPALLFIHLGSNPPKYLKFNLLRSKELFSNVQVVLAGNAQESKALAESAGVSFIELDERLGDPIRQESQLVRSGFDLGFWGGYWQKTLDRLIAFEEIHKSLPSGPVLHVEGDVVLMPNFPFEELMSSKEMRWVGFNEDSDIASIVYSPSRETSSWFSRNLVKVVSENNGLSDMRALRKLRELFPHKVSLLDALPMSEEDGQVEWVFDGLHFGDWLFGWDPNAHWGFKRRRMKTTCYSKDLEQFNFEVSGDTFLVRSNGKIGKIANLHVHSKEIDFFKIDISDRLNWLVDQASLERRFYGFSPQSCLRWGISRMKRWSRSIWKISAWKSLVACRKSRH